MVSEGVELSVKELQDNFINVLLKAYSKRKILKKPPIDLPERKVLPLLGTIAADVLELDDNQ